jgi:enamidase
MISAGEVHVPGRPNDPVGVKALAIATHKCYSNYRPGGVKLMAGAPLLEPGLTKDDFSEMASHGVKLIGEVGIGGVTDVRQASQMVAWALEFGMKSLTHTGGPSIPSSRMIVAEEILEIDPDVIGHINGGHTALPRKQIQCLCESCNRGLEIVHNGNEFAAIYALNLAREMGQLERITLGTDAPSGAGVPALGMIRLIAFLSSFGDIPAEQVFCFATGNTAKIRELDAGILEVGRPADIVIADKPKGGEGNTMLESVNLGNLPGIAMVLSDGKPAIFPSQNTPPANKLPVITELDARFFPNLMNT